MFLLSKKLVYLLVIMALVFGGDRRSAEGLKCWDSAQATSVECEGPDGDVACEAKKVGDKITKRCNGKTSEWKDEATGQPKHKDGVECWCLETDCNKEDSYCKLDEAPVGITGTGGGTGGGSGSGGSVGGVGDKLTSGAAIGAIIPPVLAVLISLITAAVGSS